MKHGKGAAAKRRRRTARSGRSTRSGHSVRRGRLARGGQSVRRKRSAQGKRSVRGARPAPRRRARKHALTAFCVALALIMLGLSLYVGWWYVNRNRIRTESERYAQLYPGREGSEPTPEITIAPTPEITAGPTPEITIAPTIEPIAVPTPTAEPTPEPTPTVEITPTPTIEVTPSPTPEITPEPTAMITIAPTPEPTPTPTTEPTPIPTLTVEPTAVPTPTPEITIAPTSVPSPTPTAVPFGADMPVVDDEPIPTPGADTKVYALPTAPPVQASFDALLALNPETVGFLDIEGMLSLPVAQRENDNEYYLSHTFEGDDASEGALFLDGMNRLVPEDDCLIVYGHNMKNDTMFGKLDLYEDVAYLRQHPVIRFDTIYENRSYVAFAAFTASMRPGSRRYFDVRKFLFDEAEFDKFVLKLQSRSLYRVPVGVRYGDRLLLLVTCDYTNPEGRFILALRQLRADETEGDAWAAAMGAAAK